LFGFGRDSKRASAVQKTLAAVDGYLNENTLKGRQSAFQVLMPLLEQADAEGWDEHLSALFSRLGDIYAQGEDYETALNAYSDAVRSPKGLGDEHIHLRLGKTQFELGNRERAADELCRAYMGGGKELFDDEPPKYFEFLKTKIKPGPEGW